MPTSENDLQLLERQSGVALWRQIADALRLQIAAGDFDELDRLPPEMQLAQTYSCNRHTVRAALSALAKEGIVEARQGQGTFVIEQRRITYPIGRRTRFSDGLADQTDSTSSSLLDSAIEPSPAEVASALNIEPGQNVVRLETLSSADGLSLSRSTSWFSHQRFPEMAKRYARYGSITQSLKSLGIDDYFRHSTQIEARHANAMDAQSLGLSAGAIVLFTQAINADTSGNPIQYSTTRFAADRIRLSIQNDV